MKSESLKIIQFVLAVREFPGTHDALATLGQPVSICNGALA